MTNQLCASYSWPVSALVLALLLGNIGIMLYSHLGTAAVVVLEYSGIDEDVYTISFVSSVKDCFDMKAYFLGIVVLVFSGVWPYAKSLIMCICWFVPMDPSIRRCTLKWMMEFSRLSFIDTFFISFLLIGIKISGTIDVAVESRSSAWTFAIAVIWDLFVGDWMRRENHKRDAESHAKLPDPDDATCLPQKDGCGSPSFTALLLYRAALPFSVIACIAFGFAICVDFAEFTYDGTLVGSGVYDYSMITMLKALYCEDDSCDIISTPAGSVFLGLVVLFFAIVVPGLATLASCIALLLKADHTTNFWFDHLRPFACLDVFFISAIVALVEWDSWTDKLAEDFEDISSLFTIELTGSFKTAGLVIFIVWLVANVFIMYHPGKPEVSEPEGETEKATEEITTKGQTGYDTVDTR